MVAEEASFEANMQNLEKIVEELQTGDIPLEKALTEYQKGVELSNKLEKTLTNAKQTLAKMETSSGEEVPFKRDRGYDQAADNSNGHDEQTDDEADPF